MTHNADPLDLPPPEDHEVWPIEGQVVRVKIKKDTHTLRIPKELETENEVFVVVEPKE